MRTIAEDCGSSDGGRSSPNALRIGSMAAGRTPGSGRDFEGRLTKASGDGRTDVTICPCRCKNQSVSILSCDDVYTSNEVVEQLSVYFVAVCCRDPVDRKQGQRQKLGGGYRLRRTSMQGSNSFFVSHGNGIDSRTGRWQIRAPTGGRAGSRFDRRATRGARSAYSVRIYRWAAISNKLIDFG